LLYKKKSLKKSKKYIWSSVKYLLLSIAALSFIYPFIWMLSASLTPAHEIYDITLFPRHPSLKNLKLLISAIPIGRSLLNSTLVAFCTTVLVLVTGSTVGYALGRMRFRGRSMVFYVIIFTMSLPFQVTLIPNYITMVNLRLIDSFLALIIPFSVSAFAILLFRQAFQGLPQALIDAAHMDGCSELTIIFKILWPNIKPTIITIAIISFIGSWNEVLWPLLTIRNEKLMTMPQLVTLFVVGGRADSQLGVKIAAAVFLALPILITFIFLQKQFIQSMASTGLKD
jgi:ABC-type glycerol-3-phosphate transport system permease component